ncbi:hypothetical protein TCAL_07661 [Tigriopus californicus]|uniref:Ig-like domain-containing protein n=1 Tax=Tigriopus californicus TaxID=6832 RepID=A0A553NP89_TIGCA|nr:hypothetical protein TCAL_07661 [Tigriopus californicus]
MGNHFLPKPKQMFSSKRAVTPSFIVSFTISGIKPNTDSHILYIGRDRFVHENRYELILARHGSWTLKLKYVSARDAGRFECQVSTVPKISQTYALKVVVPSVKILGDREVHVKSGTSVSLRCLISNVLEEPSYVFWYKEDKRLLSADDGNITITTKRIIGDGAAVSSLTIEHPDPTHSGIYSCRPANLERAFVSLHVIQDEKPAAMQHEKQAVAAVAEASASGGPSKASLSSKSILTFAIIHWLLGGHCYC